MSVDVPAIVSERLSRWAKTLADAHATPVVLVAVGHDHAAGQIVVLAVDDRELANDVLAAFLTHAARELQGKRT